MSKRERRSVYEKVASSAKNIHPYHSICLEDFHEYLKHEDSIKIILTSLENRKDADKTFMSSLINNWKFWLCVMIPVILINIIISCFIGYLFCYYPKTASHIIEKSVNSQVPELIPAISDK